MAFTSELRGKSVFVTGHTGFKGSWLTLWLAKLGARVTGFALAPPTDPSNFAVSKVAEVVEVSHESDIRDFEQLRSAIERAAPDLIIHLAAQPLVRESYREPLYTFETNVMGTVNLLEAIRTLGLGCAVVVVTSDKCYENREWDWGYRESDSMGGIDPYSASKGATELVVSSYRRSFFQPTAISRHGVSLASARAGNVIGGGDWSPDHLIVDAMSDLSTGNPIRLRNPNSVRPWQHVLDCLSGYLTLAEALLGEDRAQYCEGWNFGPGPGDAIRVSELAGLLVDGWGTGCWTDVSDPNAPHEAGVLRLSIDKSTSRLNWYPRWNVRQAAACTVEWYQRFFEDPSSSRQICEEQIARFEGER